MQSRVVVRSSLPCAPSESPAPTIKTVSEIDGCGCAQTTSRTPGPTKPEAPQQAQTLRGLNARRYLSIVIGRRRRRLRLGLRISSDRRRWRAHKFANLKLSDRCWPKCVDRRSEERRVGKEC